MRITITIAALGLLSFCECWQKFQVCVVDGRGAFKKAGMYCPILDGPDSKVECVVALDRLDCLRRISKGKADFAVFTPEDLVTASILGIEVLITNEMKFTEDAFEYEVVAVVSDDARIKNRYDLRDKKLCHPGYGYEADWTRILANYLELSVVPQSCAPQLTLTENRIKSSSTYFRSACKAGPWVNEDMLDAQLKQKFSNLCALCNTPYKCGTDDKYWGRSGPLLCLTDGAGDITWARLDDVRSHFGLSSSAASVASPKGYSYLCPNGTVIPLSSKSPPCVWVSKPWPVIATRRTSAQDIQQLVSSLNYDHDPKSWKTALLNLIETYHLNISPLNPIEAIGSYLARATGFLSANSYPGCHPPRTIRMCTVSNSENAKCSWLREAATVYGIEPDIECLQASNKTRCMQAINDNLVDLVIVSPDLVHVAQTNYSLKTLFYETAVDADKYITVAVVKKNSGIKTFQDLEGKKACFPVYDGVAWNSVIHTLHNKSLLRYCPFTKGMAEFFDSSCVPHLPKHEPKSLKSLCRGDVHDGDYGAMRCLTGDNGDVAFVSKNAFQNFFKDIQQKGNVRLDLNDFEILCSGEQENCHLSWAPLGQAMIKSNSSSLWIKDSLDVFLQMDDLFGKNFKSLTTPFTMFGLFDGKPDVLFKDATARLREVPVLKNIDTMPIPYSTILENIRECRSSGSTFALLNVLLVVVLCMSLHVI